MRTPGVLAAAAAVVTALAGLVAVPTATAADPVVRDGTSAANAAASCWEIKQVAPSSASGAYWLQTPRLAAPQQFYCDQTTDGGGWVLVGRGREGWQEFYGGQGSPSTLLALDRSPSGFSTVQLPATTVDGLLDGRAVKDLPDGVRVVRARNATGTQWQEVRFRMSKRDRWVWAFSAGHPLTQWRFDTGSWSSGGTTSNFGSGTSFTRLQTDNTSAQGYTAGFAYGSSVAGTASSTSFLWSNSNNQGYARPYAEVYVRPRLVQSDLTWASLPQGGTEKTEQRAIASSYAARGSWGVTGHYNGRASEGNAEVQDFAESAGKVYVAGNFSRVQAGANATGDNNVAQAALAAFDASTGAFVRSFRPTFNNQVKSVVVLPTGNILALGDFTEANGAEALGSVLLDPVTGTTVSSWNLKIENRLSSGVLTVRTAVLKGDYVYLGGGFTHLSGGTRSNVYARHAGRVDWRTSTPDVGWNPEFDGTLVSNDVDPAGTRMYAAGYFTLSKGQYANKAAAVQTVTGAPLATPVWTTVWSSADRTGYQQAIRATDDRVYSGGSEHSIFGYDPTTFQRLSGSITNGIGGDFQALDTDGSVIYGGCHCSSWSYENSFTWSNVGSAWTQADKIQWVGAWDVATGAFLPAFNPPFLRSNNAGAWALFVASDGTLWVGGDFTGSRYTPTASQWNGGFVRFPEVDHTAPTAPSNLRSTGVVPGSVDLAWSGSTDGTGVAGYEVLRDDRVVATSTGTSASVPRAGADRYAVRAIDAAGNRSASTAVLVVTDSPEPPDEPEDPTEAVLVEEGASWAYRNSNSAPPAGWAQNGFDDSSWSRGDAPFGWGTTVATNIDPGTGTANRPVTSYMRTSFELENALAVHKLLVSAVADDGAVVHVNGVEVGRARLDAGPVSFGTYANAAVSTTVAKASRLEVEVPLNVLVDGTNTIAIETHVNYRSTPNVYADLTATATLGDPRAPEEEPEPEVPDPPTEVVTTLVAADATWAYRSESAAPPSDWASATFDHSGWSLGEAPLGWGAGVATNIDAAATTAARPLGYYFRKTATIEDLAKVVSLRLTVPADDGAVVYVNGAEVGRQRLTGNVTHSTYADAAVSTATALGAPLVVDVPTGLLVEGANILAVETHVNYRSTPNLSMRLEATLTSRP